MKKFKFKKEKGSIKDTFVKNLRDYYGIDKKCNEYGKYSEQSLKNLLSINVREYPFKKLEKKDIK